MSGTARGDFDYDRARPDYSGHRRADPRIGAMVREAFGAVTSLVNVGAGAGSYEPDDRLVVAVEPSATMRAQRAAGSAPVVNAVAGALPFADDSFGAALASLTVHQWPDAEQGLRELRRVARERVVVLTFDGTALERFWLADYAPELIAVERRRYPAVDRIVEVLGGDAEVRVVPLALDCTDGFAEAFYGRPERLLDPAVRAAQSAWGFVAPEAVERSVARLRTDLESGRWDERHSALRTQPQFRGSLRLVVADIVANVAGR